MLGSGREDVGSIPTWGIFREGIEDFVYSGSDYVAEWQGTCRVRGVAGSIPVIVSLNCCRLRHRPCSSDGRAIRS